VTPQCCTSAVTLSIRGLSIERIGFNRMDSIPQNYTQYAFDFDALADQPIEHVPHIVLVPSQDQKYWWSDLEHRTIPRSSGIYAIVNTKNQHFYIGSAKNLLQRKSDHFKRLKAGNHENPHLQHAYNRYGSNDFLFVIVEHVDHVKSLILREQYYMDFMTPEYNIARIAGSNLGVKHTPETIEKFRRRPRTPETKEKLRLANLGIPPSPKAIENSRAANLGKPRTPKTKEKLRVANIGRKHTPASKAKMSAAKLGKKQSPEHIESRIAPTRGRRKAPESIEKMSAAKKGKKFSPEHRANLSIAAKQRKKRSSSADNQPPSL